MSESIRVRALVASTLAIPFTTRFRHASAERAETSSVWLEATSDAGVTGYGESCPRPYVTGETLASAEAFIDRHAARVGREVTGLDSLRTYAQAHGADLDANPAAWCAIELAVLDLVARTQREPIEALLGQPPLSGPFRYSAVLGDAEPDTFARQAERYLAMGFRDLKVKLSGDLARDRAKLDVLWAAPDVRVRVDANNLWRAAGVAAEYLTALGGPIAAVEEPLAPGDVEGLAQVAAQCGVPIVLDESVTRTSQLAALPGAAVTWIVNVRVSKMGGLLRSLEVVAAARAAGIRVVVGAQVGETSLLTRAALTVAQAAGAALFAQEGAFGTFLLTRDVCDPPLMFAAGGLLRVSDHPRLTQPGFGITGAQ